MLSVITACMLFVTNLALAQAPAPPSHAERVLALLAAKDFATVETQFNDKVKAGLPPGRLAGAWANLVGEAGTFKKQISSRTQTAGEFRITVLTCAFEHANVDVQIVFDAADRIAGLSFRPAVAPPEPYALPAYATPASYTEGEVTIGSGEWALPATLEMPVGAGPFAAVILVHGSGPNDRDESIGANKPFKDLATGLASRGIAVLRYDKRTKVYGAKLAKRTDLTVQLEVLDDVLAATSALRANPKIDGRRLFVLGHSLGGMLIPRIGLADPSLAGLIVMAGPARGLDQAILAQTKYLAMADATVTPQEQAAIADATKLVDAVRDLKPEDAKNGKTVSGAPASYWLDLRGYDPPVAAKAVKAPMLILQGERDYQVTMDEFGRWKAALGARRDVTFHSYPGLNHLFITGTGKSMPAEYETAGHVAEAVVRDIAAWISATKSDPTPGR